MIDLVAAALIKMSDGDIVLLAVHLYLDIIGCWFHTPALMTEK